MAFRHSWLSIMGLWNYDNSIFDSMVLPEQLDRQALVGELLTQLAELELVYTNPDTIKFTLSSWSRTRLPVWQHLYDTTMYKYEPLNTYNMETIGKKTGNITGNSKDDFIANQSFNGNEKKTGSINYDENANGDEKGNEKELTKGNDAYSEVEQDNNWVYGYNSADKALRNSEDDTTKSTDDWNTDRGLNDGRDWRKSEHDITSSNENIDKTHSKWDKSGRLKEEVEDSVTDTVTSAEGNTGIYARQDLIQKERDIALFDVYDFIIRDFKKRFCIQVW